MSLNKFYTIHDTQGSDNKLSCRIEFNADHDIFKGHFPGHPVVPGVCMIEIVKELLQRTTGKDLTLRQAGNVKFLRLIVPDSQPLVDMNWKDTETGYHVNVVFKEGEATLFRMDGTYEIIHVPVN